MTSVVFPPQIVKGIRAFHFIPRHVEEAGAKAALFHILSRVVSYTGFGKGSGRLENDFRRLQFCPKQVVFLAVALGCRFPVHFTSTRIAMTVLAAVRASAA